MTIPDIVHHAASRFSGLTTDAGQKYLPVPAVAAGNLMVAILTRIGTAGTPPSVVGAGWTELGSYTNTAAGKPGWVVYAKMTGAGGSDKVTIDEGTTSGFVWAIYAEFSGTTITADPENPASKKVNWTPVESTKIVTPTRAPTYSGDLVIAFMLTGNPNATSGATLSIHATTGTLISDSAFVGGSTNTAGYIWAWKVGTATKPSVTFHSSASTGITVEASGGIFSLLPKGLPAAGAGQFFGFLHG